MKERKIIGLFCILMVTMVFACTKGPEFPDEPVIKSVQLSAEMIDGVITPGPGGQFTPDSLFVVIAFEDGNNDVGYSDQDAGPNIPPPSFVDITDNRNGLVSTILLSGVNSQSGNDSVSGTITIKYSACCVGGPNNGPICLPNDILPETSEVTFDIVLRDRAGNFSNVVTSPVLILDCYPD